MSAGDPVFKAYAVYALFSKHMLKEYIQAMILDFLQARCGIGSLEELKTAVRKMLETTDLNIKKCDFEHLLFDKRNADRILRFGEFVESI